MNIIFLDIDGVVNTLQIDNKPFDTVRGQISRDGLYYELNMPEDKKVSNRQAVMWLNKICLETDSKIVITSTWRLGVNGMKLTEEALRNSGLLDNIEIIGMTPIVQSSNYHIRGDEIRCYLSEHPEVNKFIILDDDCDMAEFQNRLVKIDTYVGITYHDYLKAIEMFK